MRRMITWTLLLLTVVSLVQPALATDSPFPAQLSFTVRKASGLGSGSFRLTFGDDWNAPAGVEGYQIVMSDFASLAFESNQQLISTVTADDLSLYGHVVREGSVVKRELFLDLNCKSAMDGSKTRCFKYKEEADGGTALQTEIFTPYHAIDFISSIVVATRAAAEKDFKERDYNFIFNDLTRQVRLVLRGSEEITTAFGKMKVKVLALVVADTGVELYRFYIGRDRHGEVPVRLVYEDSKEGTIEFRIDTVKWEA